MLLFKLRNRLLDLPKFPAQAARQPVVLAQSIEHGPAHALGGISLELRTHACLEPVDGIKQSDHAVLYQVIDLDTGRKTGHQMIGNALDEWSEPLYQLILFDLTCCVIHIPVGQA